MGFLIGLFLPETLCVGELFLGNLKQILWELSPNPEGRNYASSVFYCRSEG